MYVCKTHTPLPFMPKLCISALDPAAMPTATGALQSTSRKVNQLNLGDSFSKSFIITYLLFTTVTAQQSPCLTSGRPLGGTTTPGSMRSKGQNSFYFLILIKWTLLNITPGLDIRQRTVPAPPINFWSTRGHVLNTGRRAGYRQSTYTAKCDNAQLKRYLKKLTLFYLYNSFNVM